MSIQTVLNYCKNKFQNNSISVIEIGARYGESSILIMKNLNVKNYYIIDPYESYENYSIDGFNNVLKKNKNIYETTYNKLNRKFPKKNIIFYRKFSNDKEIIEKFSDESIDLIFVDGNHCYNYVLEDLENYFPKIKKGGIICGDDYFMRHKDNDIKKSGAGYDEKMVYEAVNDFSKKINKEFKTFGEHRKYPITFLFEK